MTSKQWGDPVISLRLPKWQIAGLKKLANMKNTSVSELVRDQIAALLEKAGLSPDSVHETTN